MLPVTNMASPNCVSARTVKFTGTKRLLSIFWFEVFLMNNFFGTNSPRSHKFGALNLKPSEGSKLATLNKMRSHDDSDE